MKKSIIMMCIGGLLALCTPLAASETSIDPPVKNEVVNTSKNYATATEQTSEPVDAPATKTASDAETWHEHPGGVVVISGTGLLLLIILLIILL